jgi:hypothetical protein
VAAPSCSRRLSTQDRFENEPPVVHAETVVEQPVVDRNPVVVIVPRKMRVQAIARFRRLPVTDSVRQNNKVTRCV